MGGASEGRKERIVILDASILLDSIEAKIDLVNEIREALLVPCKICVLKSTLDELERLERKGPRRRSRAAKLARAILGSRNIEIVDDTSIGYSSVDDRIVQVARGLRAVVATSDGELRRKLASEGVPVVFLREGKKVQLAGDVYI